VESEWRILFADIVFPMIRFEAKGYRKEIRKLREGVQSLRGSEQRRSTTEMESASSSVGGSPELSRGRPVLPAAEQTPEALRRIAPNARPLPPQRLSADAIASATAVALRSASSSSLGLEHQSAPQRPKTPLSSHKKLPKPPSSPKPTSTNATQPPAINNARTTSSLLST
jgi:hypothetical protein